MPDSLDPNASPVQLVRAMQAEIGAEALAHWCVGLLTGRVAYDDPTYPPLSRLAGSGAAWELQVGNIHERGSGYWPRVWGGRGLLHGWEPAVAGEAIPALVGALDDNAWRVREMAAKVIRRWEIAEAADRLAGLIDDETPRVRVAALRALAVVGESEHGGAIRSALDDPEKTVRTAAEEALRRLDVRLDGVPADQPRAKSTPRRLTNQAARPPKQHDSVDQRRPRRTRSAVTADDLEGAVAAAIDALQPGVALDWSMPAGDLAWTCAKTCAHIADDLFAFAGQLAARVPIGYLPFVVSPRRKTAPPGLLGNVEAGSALLVLAVRAAPPEARGFHPWGQADAEGFAALGAAEVIVHTYDIATGLDLAYDLDDELCTRILDRLGADIDMTAVDLAAAKPSDVLLWAAGRHDLGDRPRRTRWRWWPGVKDD